MNRNYICVFILLWVVFHSKTAASHITKNDPSIGIAHVEAHVGDVVDVAVTANGFGSIQVFQCWIGFSGEVLDFVSFTNVFPGISGMATNQIGDTLLLSWFGIPAVGIPDGTVLFEMRFNFCNDLLQCALNGTQSPVFLHENQAYITNENFEQFALQLHHGSVYSDNPLRVLDISIIGQGEVLVNGNVYSQPIVVDNDTLFELQALPSDEYDFINWTDPEGNVVSDQPEYSFTMHGNHVFLTANFTESAPDSYMLTFNVTNEFDAVVDDAVVVLNDNSYPPGQYNFENLLPGTYSFDISHPCNITSNGETVITNYDKNISIVLNTVTGDANGNGQFNVMDLLIVVNYYAINHTGLFCFYNADVNQDGMINILDVIILAQMFGDTTE